MITFEMPGTSRRDGSNEVTPRFTSWSRGATAMLAAVGAATLAAGLFVPAAQAQTPAALSYVSPAGAAGNADSSCGDAAFSSIQAAADATAPGGTVVVCRGTYDQSVTITSLLTLQGLAGSVIDAEGQPYGVGIAYSQVVVTGLTVEDATANSKTEAPGDGIITAGFVNGKPVASNDDVIVNDVTTDNEGAGIDLNSTTGSVAAHNVSRGNGVGINISNDLGLPASHNDVAGNVTSDNPGGCGIVLADHTGVGVFDNVITGNTSNGNGLGTPSRPNASSGSGVILAADGKSGGVWGNTIESNQLSANGHAGVVVHAHAPGLNFSGDEIIDNTIGVNNLRTDYKDTATTGVYLGAASALRITVAGNTIERDAVGVFSAGPVTVLGMASNSLVGVGQPSASVAKF